MTLRKVRPLLFALALVGMAFCLGVVPAHAQTIQDLTLTIDNPTQIVQPTSTTTYTGTITNNTGSPLDIYGSFLTLNFSGYGSLTNPTSLVGLGGTPPGPEFVIPNGGTSPDFDIFTDALGPDAPLGSYPVQLQLSDAGFDVSNVVTVTEIVTPEPTTWSLALIGVALFFLWRFRGLLSQKFGEAARGAAILSLSALLFWASPGYGGTVAFVGGSPGASLFAPNLSVAIPLINDGTTAAANVQVTSITSPGATLTSPAAFPVPLGTIPAGGNAPVFASFTSAAFAPGGTYLVTIKGNYVVSGTVGPTLNFAVNKFVTIPAASPGENIIGTVLVNPNTVTGAPFPHQAPDMGDEVNAPGPLVPIGPFVPVVPTPNGTASSPAPSAPGVANTTLASGGDPSVSFLQNEGLGLTGAGLFCSPGTPPSSCAEPSGAATAGGVIFMTANWLAAYSTNSGGSFTTLDPTTIFPHDGATGGVGFCCDQIVQYIPGIDRYVWLLQGNGYRLATASPATINSSGGTAWTYWNLTPSVFGPSSSSFDYPSMSVGNNYLYIDWDANCSPSCSGGRQVVRIKLTDIQAGGTIEIDYTHQSDSSLAWGSHVTQDTGGEIFWAGHNGNSTLRVWSWAEGSNTYFWRDIGIGSWANNTLSSKTPDGQDWLAFGFPGHSPIGATRASNQLWFAWTAGTDSNFKQAHIEMVTLDRSNNFNLLQQVQVWNPGFAFAYPALATNACTGEIGLALEEGGNGSYENFAMGFWGDFVVYQPTNSSFGENRFGDYVTIRQDPNLFGGQFAGSYFDALGYGVDKVNGGPQADVRYAVFGRAGECILQ